ncbi:MAG: ATP-binding protein, partial [Bdellovibrionota bacterium]
GSVHLEISMGFINRLIDALWRTTAAAAFFSVIVLIVVLSYFLRKTIANDRLLRLAETQNIQLTEKLHDVHRQLLNTEKLAVMGQLTASFAHEIGTPLNAIGGHLQLLRDEVGTRNTGAVDRLEVINGQVTKIEKIVKNFLQSTAKPASQTQLVDLNLIADKTLGIVRPRSESLGIEIKRDLDRGMGPVRAVPLEIEQILLNLVNNSLDSLSSKRDQKEKTRLMLEISSKMESFEGKHWAEITVYDTGEGISKEHLKNVLKPFFTTKRPGEGTGLGLTICRDLANKYGGELQIDSKEGAWTRATLKLPYQVKQ